MKIHCDNCGWNGSEDELICPYDTFDERCPNCNNGWNLIEVEDIPNMPNFYTVMNVEERKVK